MRFAVAVLLTFCAFNTDAQEQFIFAGAGAGGGLCFNNNGGYFPWFSGITSFGVDAGYGFSRNCYLATGIYETKTTIFVSDRRYTAFDQSRRLIDIPLFVRYVFGQRSTDAWGNALPADRIKKAHSINFYLDLGAITGTLTKATADRTEVNSSFNKMNLRPALGFGMMIGCKGPIRFLLGGQFSSAISNLNKSPVNGIREDASLSNFSINCSLQYYFRKS